MDKRILRERIEATELRVADAKNAVEALLGELRVLPRAEKMTITATVKDAFDKLRAAQEELAALEQLILIVSSEFDASAEK